MPPYFSVYYSFPYTSVSDQFVSEVYSVFFNYFPYKSGYWQAEKNSLEEIISWNSDLLTRKFELGFDQHVMHDYKQLLLESEKHEHLRLFWNYQNNEVTLHMITPEHEVLLDDKSWRFNGERIYNLINLSVKLWENQKLNVVQTYHELDAPESLSKVCKGVQPRTNPFCIVDEQTFLKLEKQLETKYYIKHIKNGVMIIERDYASLVRG
jgi:hypothetical protein